VDINHSAIQIRGAAVGTVQDIDPTYPDLNTVSCAGTRFCVAVDDAGNYMVGR